jgi:uncharacterized protein (UPF0212 family)
MMRIMRTNCPACGANVDLAIVEGTDDRVPLEIAAEVSAVADRYAIISHAPLVARLVSKDAAGAFFPDHRHDCPGHGNGL